MLQEHKQTLDESLLVLASKRTRRAPQARLFNGSGTPSSEVATELTPKIADARTAPLTKPTLSRFGGLKAMIAMSPPMEGNVSAAKSVSATEISTGKTVPRSIQTSASKPPLPRPRAEVKPRRDPEANAHEAATPENAAVLKQVGAVSSSLEDTHDGAEAMQLRGKITEQALLEAPWGASLHWLSSPVAPATPREEVLSLTSGAQNSDPEQLISAPWAELLALFATAHDDAARAPTESGVVAIHGETRADLNIPKIAAAAWE